MKARRLLKSAYEIICYTENKANNHAVRAQTSVWTARYNEFWWPEPAQPATRAELDYDALGLLVFATYWHSNPSDSKPFWEKEPWTVKNRYVQVARAVVDALRALDDSRKGEDRG